MSEENKVIPIPVEDNPVEENDGVVIDELEDNHPDDDAISVDDMSNALVLDEKLNIEDEKEELPTTEDDIPTEEISEVEVPEQPPMLVYHFTHNDADAVGCALVTASLKDYNTKTIFSSLEEIDNNIVGFLSDRRNPTPDAIIITDVSLKDETCNYLETYTVVEAGPDAEPIPLMLFDHHVTNKMAEKYNWCHVITEENGVLISAAKILYNELSKEELNLISPNYKEKLGLIIDSISRYDTWEWKNNPSDYKEEYTNILIKQAGIVEAFNILYRSLIASVQNTEDHVFRFSNEALLLINTYIKKREKALDTIAKRGVVATTFQEYNIALMIPDSTYFNESLETIYNLDDSIDIVFGLIPETRTLSLRSKKDDVNLARFAKYYYNGGGHKKAAGAKLSKEDFMALLDQYYTGLDYIEKEEAKEKEENREPNEETNLDIK